MDRKAASGITLILLLTSMLTLAFVIQRLEANPIYPGQVVMTREDIDAIVFNNNSIAQAKVNGTYTFHSYGSYGVTMYYPVPPNATNISVKIDGTTLDWEWAIDWIETHYHTVIGDYPLIEWSIDDVPLDFTIMTHYEHTVPLIEGKYQFLYALGTGRYLADPKDCEAYIETYIGKDVAPTQSCIEVYLATEDGVLEPATYEITSIDGMWKVIYYVEFYFWSKDFLITITPTNSTPVGGIYIPVNKLELLAPYIGLTILLAVAVMTVVYVKKRKRLALRQTIKEPVKCM